MADEEYLYRGTTPDWPGNVTVQEAQMTPTTTDPLVATLFAIECRNYGPGTILFIPKGRLKGLIGPPNYLAELESAVNLMISPVELFQHAECRIDADAALVILEELVFVGLPLRLNGPDALRIALLETQENAYRLSPAQIQSFNRQVLRRKP